MIRVKTLIRKPCEGTNGVKISVRSHGGKVGGS